MDYKARMIQNEQLIRDRNKEASKGIKKYFRGRKEVVKAPLDFMCECSDLKCNERVKMSIEEYEKNHKRNNRFVIAKGHKTPSIEETIDQNINFDVVEKPQLAP